MASPIRAVLTDPEQREQPDIEIRHTDSFLRIRGEEAAAERPREEEPVDGES